MTTVGEIWFTDYLGMFKHDNSIPFAAIKIIWVHDSTILLVMWAQTEKYAKNNPNYPTPSYILVYIYTLVYFLAFFQNILFSHLTRECMQRPLTVWLIMVSCRSVLLQHFDDFEIISYWRSWFLWSFCWSCYMDIDLVIDSWLDLKVYLISRFICPVGIKV